MEGTVGPLTAELTQKLIAAMRELNEMKVLTLALDMVEAEESAYTIFEALLEGIRQVDERYEAGEYFIADLIMAGHIMQSVMDTALVFPESEESGSMGSVVLCTVQGDIHDLGKRAVAEVLAHNGFRVRDLGVDVSPESTVAALRETKPDILILSGTLNLSAKTMRETVRAVEKSGLRQSVRILVGGAAVKDISPRVLGADEKCGSILDALRKCHALMALAAGDAR